MGSTMDYDELMEEVGDIKMSLHTKQEKMLVYKLCSVVEVLIDKVEELERNSRGIMVPPPVETSQTVT